MTYPKPTPIEIAPCAVTHIIRALQADINRQEQMGLECGDNWPEDFDANDVRLFDLVLQEILQQNEGVVTLSYPFSKPSQFARRIIVAYIEDQRFILSPEEIGALEKVAFI